MNTKKEDLDEKKGLELGFGSCSPSYKTKINYSKINNNAHVIEIAGDN